VRPHRFLTLAILAGSALLTMGCDNQTAVHFPAPVVQTQPSAEARIVYPEKSASQMLLPGGSTHAVLSLLNIRRSMEFGDYVWDDDNIPEGPVLVRVDLASQTLSVFRAGHEIGATVILFGADNKPTPSGVFRVLAKAQKHRSNLYDAEMPFMLRLTNDGVAIHASAVREGAATHGCVGVPLEFARLLFGQVRVGDPVAIVAA